MEVVMNRRGSPQRLALHASLVVGLLSVGCADIVGADFKQVVREEKHFTTTGKPEVDLSTFDGPIELRPWDKSEVQVIIEKRGRDDADVRSIDVKVEQTGNRIVIDVRAEKHANRGLHLGWYVGRSAKLIASVPAAADVSARSGDGSIDIERISGTIKLHSGDGSIRARELGGDVNVETGDGSIALDGKFSALRAHSGDGSVRVEAAPGSTASNDWDITTGDGSVTLEIPNGFGGELDAHTGDGRIHLNDVTLTNVTGEIGRNTVRGRLGSGGGAVRIRTGDGSITLRSGLR
jgi:DUF4097 and DUF4098 domain-containing protein YvlB